MRKISIMTNLRLLQDNSFDKKSYNWVNSNNNYQIEKHNQNGLTGCESAICTFCEAV